MLDPAFVAKFRISLIAMAFFILYMVLCVRLWNVQVLDGAVSREKVDRQYIRDIRIPAVRGRILSSDGVVLAGNRPVYQVVFHISEMREPGRNANTLNHIMKEIERVGRKTGIRPDITREDVKSFIDNQAGLPMVVISGLDRTSLAKAYELSQFIPGMEVVRDTERYYPCGRLAAHLLGFARPDDPSSADDRKSYSYYVPDIIGKAGLERACDTWTPENPVPAPLPDDDSADGDNAPPAVENQPERLPLLRGTPGKQVVIVDHRKFIRSTIGPVIPAENGKDIILTLDARAQSIVERLLVGVTGSIVVMDPETGAVIAMATSPTYDPAFFLGKFTRSQYAALQNAPGRPLLNRAIQSAYSPGSIIKPLVALAALGNGISPDKLRVCDGATEIGASRIRCWINPVTGGGHGEIDLKEGITVSCNCFFIETGLELGIDKMAEEFESAGIGSKTGFILGESAGRLPAKSHKPDWNAFDTALVAIGHGDILISPLRAAVYFSAIANGGTLWKPYLVKNIVGNSENVIYSAKPVKKGELKASKENLAIVLDAMHNAVNAENGSAKHAQSAKVDLCGKTGTAEIGPKEHRKKSTWFAGIAKDLATPRKFVIIVNVENGVSGGRTCAPLAKQFFDFYLE